MEELSDRLFNELAEGVNDLECFMQIIQVYEDDVILRLDNYKAKRIKGSTVSKEDMVALEEAYQKTFGYLEKSARVLAVYDAFMKIVPNHDTILQERFSDHKTYFEELRGSRLAFQQKMLAHMCGVLRMLDVASSINS